MDVIRNEELHTPFNRDFARGCFQVAQRAYMRGIVPFMNFSEDARRHIGAARQRLLPDGGHHPANKIHGLIDERHAVDHKGNIFPLSTISGRLGENHPASNRRPPCNSLMMVTASEEKRAALRRFMKARGLKAKPWAVAAGLDPATVRHFLNGPANSMRHETLEKLAKAADATISELIGEKIQTPRLSRDVVAIQGLDVQASMGGGVEVSDESATEPFFFRKTFVDRVSPGHGTSLRVIELTGDSMEPTLSDGDVALIDLNAINVASAPGVYCLWNGTGLVVKRVQVIPGAKHMLRIKSDNTNYEPDVVDPEDVRIIGRVIWRGGMV